MKAWGMKLARMIYEDKMSDEAIISTLKDSQPASMVDVEWIKRQIKTVRNNPKMWRPLSKREA